MAIGQIRTVSKDLINRIQDGWFFRTFPTEVIQAIITGRGAITMLRLEKRAEAALLKEMAVRAAIRSTRAEM